MSTRISKIYSAQLSGLNFNTVTIEVDLSNGLHSFAVVGLGDKAVEEAKDRVSAAIKNSGYSSPKQKNQKVVISLAPADIRKEGPSFDLGMALGYLCATGDIFFDSEKKLFLGELSLEGRLRKVSGVLPLVRGACDMGFTEVYVPKQNAVEAGLVRGIKVYAVETLEEIIGHLMLRKDGLMKPCPLTRIICEEQSFDTDFSLIRGQETAKRGLEIAAAGGHNIAMYGPPGTGKTMLAKAFRTILPPLNHEEILEVTGVHSMARTLDKPFIAHPPFRSPHHTSSYASLVGGGPFPKPGELTLAHRGVLFLDEFPEFDRSAIDALRQPLEDRTITVSRARGVMTFPAQCILIASMNPCPCGYGKDGNAERKCSCTDKDIAWYRKRISGPIVDRIDLWVSVSKVEYEKLSENNSAKSNEDSKSIRKRVSDARKHQTARFKKRKIIGKKLNSEMSVSDMEKCIMLSPEIKKLLTSSAEKLSLSARAFHRVIKVARTIADLEGKREIGREHILEALQYRQRF
ncbi:MAG: YifB family Mg chelatase-like AAA ATPase [bacterium]|nr:YifB family Mg chelatase-like AAA ATPase [bacterium]